MAKRFRIGLNFFFSNETNSGIVNYVYNIISALKTLDGHKIPEIIVFHSENAPIDFLKGIEYPHICFVLYKQYPSNYFIKKINSAIIRIFDIDVYKQLLYFRRIDCLYPYFGSTDMAYKRVKNKIYWLVDFNNKVFPSHYDNKGEDVNNFQSYITSKEEKVVLSSNALHEELKTFFPDFKCKVHILRFASSLPDLSMVDKVALLERYKIDRPYMMSPNQFWEHKNQLVVLNAIRLIKEHHPDLKFKILFSGSLQVSRGKGLYIDQLKKFISEHKLEDYVSFLGVLERTDQLALMKFASALIQPSLYEGWSTLVEEAKALNQFIILSDLKVHKEQIDNNVDFFDPLNSNELAEKIIKQFQNPHKILPLDYRTNIKEFGLAALNAFSA